MKSCRYEDMRKQVCEIEQIILTTIGGDINRCYEWLLSLRKCEKVEKLIWQRKYLLDRMFVATSEEMERIEQVNERLYNLTCKMYARTESLYRKMSAITYDPEFDDDVEVEGSLKFVVNDRSSVLPMANDDYYGSDFYSMFEIIDTLYTYDVLKSKEIAKCIAYLSPADYRPEMSGEDLGLTDILNDGTTWYESCQPAAEKLSHLCICHAIHDLSSHKPYSVPDVLRMNDFWVEVTLRHQHIVEQDGSRLNWWERCSFEEFRDKFIREARQNRAPHIRLGQEIANRTRMYFNDYLEYLSADMPGVEQWKEPLSDKVHYRWRPQKDCFYLDENIDDYLRELYEFVRMR